MAGPYSRVDLGSGGQVDLYLLKFDRSGRLRSPQALGRVMEILPRHTDVYFLCHGWNNPHEEAVAKYTTFIRGYAAQRQRLGLPAPDGYRPLVVGAIWPSTAWLLPGEQGPDIAGSRPGDAAGTDEQEELLGRLREDLDEETYTRLADSLRGTDRLDRQEAEAVARILLDSLAHDGYGGGPLEDDEVPTPAEVVDAGRILEAVSSPGTAVPASDPDDFSGVDGGGEAESGASPDIAGDSKIDPRWLLRMATVWRMKSRAGTVGAIGIAPVLQDFLEKSDVRVHLVGHSFGARVMLSAATVQQARRKIYSMLLLQPAVNRWCFADKVVDRGVPGGYQPVPDRLDRPLVATFSLHDVPLHDIFHLAVRGASLGEPTIAAVGSPDKYGALGGYGPKGVEHRLTHRRAVREGGAYGLAGLEPGRIVEVDGDVDGVKVPGLDSRPEGPAIAGHGDINSTVTWWLLHTLTAPVGAAAPGPLPEG